MRIEVRVFCGLEKCIPGVTYGQPIPVDIPDGTDGFTLLERLNIPRENAFSFLVNGLHKSFDITLSEGDRVSIFPPVGGG